MNFLSENIAGKMPSGLIMVNREGKIIGHNPASERIFEGTLALTSHLRDLVRESQALQLLLDALQQNLGPNLLRVKGIVHVADLRAVALEELQAVHLVNGREEQRSVDVCEVSRK